MIRTAVLVLVAVLGAGIPDTSAAAPGGGRSLDSLTRSLLDRSGELVGDTGERRSQLLLELAALAEERRALLAGLAETDPAQVLRGSLTSRQVSGLPQEIRGKLEREVALGGRLVVFFEDAPDSGRLHHVLKDAQGRGRSLHFAESPPALRTGDRVQVRGVEVPADSSRGSGAIVVFCCNGDGFELLQAAELPNTVGEQRTAVLLVRHQNVDPERRVWTHAEARQLFFADLGDFFLEASYGQTWMDGDVYGPYTLPVDWSCAGTEVGPAAQVAASADGFDASRYDRIVYAHAQIPCGFAGKGTVGGSPSEAWINGAALGEEVVGLLAHELGHNFGLLHSHSLDCGSIALGGDCIWGEYGDLADAMGGNRGHYNSFQKERLGWIGSGSLTLATGDGDYTLQAYETATSGLPKALLIPRGTDPDSGQPMYYYVEYRQPIGSDAFLTDWDPLGGNLTSGVQVRTGTQGDADSSFLLDMTPDSLDYDGGPYTEWGDAALAFGASYVDDDAGITISAGAPAGDTVLVSVRLTGAPEPAPQNQPPTAVDDSGTTRESRAIAVRVLANDSDPDGDALIISAVSAPSHGTATPNEDGTITYEPDRRFSGADSFSYTISDGDAVDSAQVLVTVEPKSRGGGKGRQK